MDGRVLYASLAVLQVLLADGHNFALVMSVEYPLIMLILYRKGVMSLRFHAYLAFLQGLHGILGHLNCIRRHRRLIIVRDGVVQWWHDAVSFTGIVLMTNGGASNERLCNGWCERIHRLCIGRPWLFLWWCGGHRLNVHGRLHCHGLMIQRHQVWLRIYHTGLHVVHRCFIVGHGEVGHILLLWIVIVSIFLNLNRCLLGLPWEINIVSQECCSVSQIALQVHNGRREWGVVVLLLRVSIVNLVNLMLILNVHIMLILDVHAFLRNALHAFEIVGLLVWVALGRAAHLDQVALPRQALFLRVQQLGNIDDLMLLARQEGELGASGLRCGRGCCVVLRRLVEPGGRGDVRPVQHAIPVVDCCVLRCRAE